jgi:hypothetical protein
MREASSPEALMVFEAMMMVVIVAVTRPNEKEVDCTEVASAEGVGVDAAELKKSDDAVATAS